MSELERLCCAHVDFSAEDIARLLEVEKQLPLIADVTNADVFLDIRLRGDTALVVAQARPAQGLSAYEKSRLGEYAFAEKEPAVFRAFSLGMPVCDLKAITQENRTVRQNVAPVRGEGGRVIAVLIREKDVSDDLQQRKKFEELARTYEEEEPSVRAVSGEQEGDHLMLREMHHRVKNNLQLVASILNLQSRRIDDLEMKGIIRENVNRVLSIAAIHDILMNTSGDMQHLSSKTLFAQLGHNLQALIPPEKEILLTMTADEIPLTPDTATSVSLVITELVSNAFFHAFANRARGRVEVSFCKGALFHTVTVSDDGTGFDLAGERKNSLGLQIVQATVQDKLRGKLHINSGSQGTKVSFDLKSE